MAKTLLYAMDNGGTFERVEALEDGSMVVRVLLPDGETHVLSRTSLDGDVTMSTQDGSLRVGVERSSAGRSYGTWVFAEYARHREPERKGVTFL